ncbi:MAG: RnfABCDGE type electron transport complex subunit B [Bacillota bacterium]|nr:RnfABCDGE type electron transport complex subunit B [Bacillota bacterium]
MDVKNILSAGLSLASMGLLFGAGLAYASQKFEVKRDPKVEAVYDALPSANCGGCGFPGCMQFAEAVVKGDAKPNGCPVGGDVVAEKIGDALGLKVEIGEKLVARVQCKGDKDKCQTKYEYFGLDSCISANMLESGPKACSFGCLGNGDCVDVCQFDAIHITDKGIAEVDKEKCTACGACIEICPKDLIELVPYKQHVVVDCKNEERGGFVKKNCDVACIACGICERSCPFDAIHVINNVAVIDYDKCTQCMICYEKCPTNAISAIESKKQKAFIIEENCIGCSLCKKRCPVDAIKGEIKGIHTIDPEKCIGCGECIEACPKDTIIMKNIE